MSNPSLRLFEQALRQRNPILADRLEPGLSENRVRRMLELAKIDAVDSVLDLFTWKNGSRLDPSIAQHASPFPDSRYVFMDLEMMLAHFREFRECVSYHPRYTKVVGKYFPLFWDGSNCWLAADLIPPHQNRVVLVETESEHMVRHVYESFNEFLKDAIRANENNDRLKCFK